MRDKARLGKRLRGANEKEGLHLPFANAVANGGITSWAGATVYRHVCLDQRGPSGPMKCAVDLALVLPGRGLGLVECKLAKNREFRHGMIEQCLMYCEMAHRLRQLGPDTLAKRFVGRKLHGSEPPAEVFDQIVSREQFFPIIVVDRWGRTAHSTAGLTMEFLNKSFKQAGLPEIEVHVAHRGAFVPLAPSMAEEVS